MAAASSPVNRLASTMSRLHGNGAVAAVGQGVVVNVLIALATMLAGIVTARYLGASGRGELAALTTLPTFFTFIMTFGLPSSLVYHARRSGMNVDAIVAGALTVSVVAGGIAAALAYASVPFVLTELPPELLGVARALVLFTVLGVVSSVAMAALQARQRFVAYNYVRLCQPAAQLVGTAVLGLIGRLTPTSAALVVLLSGLPGLVWTLCWVLAVHRPAWSKGFSAARDMCSYSARAYGGELLLGLAGQVDKLIVVGIFQPATMGIYVVALTLSRVAMMFPSAVVVVLFPKAAGRSAREVIDITSRAAGGTALIAGATAIALIALGPTLLGVFYGDEFHAAAAAFRLLVVEATVAGIVQVLSQAFMALDRPGLITLQYGSGAVAAVPLLFLLAPTWGAEGAAAALLIASVVRLACTYWCFKGVLKIAPPRVLGEIGPSFAQLKRTAARVVPR
jgi:O-antigen/teichoic acid export membrane protein